MTKFTNTVVFIAVAVACIQFHGAVAQTRHVVGDALGWTIPPGGEVAYTTWASLQSFTVGDSLFFNFTTGQHNVAQVSAAAYGPCTTANPISLTSTGPATLTLSTAGTHYYICTVGTHCQIGQKLTINVSAAAAPPPRNAASPPPPTTAAAPSPMESNPSSPPSIATPPTTSGLSPTGSTTPSPTGSMVPPAPTGAGSSFSGVFPVTFVAIASAFFY